jgi:toxin YoeB
MAPQCLEDLEYWTDTDPRTASKVYRLIQACLRTPFEGLGKPEPLRGELAGFWSRRIAGEHRLVYRVRDDRVEFAQARLHY